jgi:hypothetical protein
MYVYYDSFWVEPAAGSVGPTGATGPTGPSSGNIDGGIAATVYGGIAPVEGGNASSF